MRSFIRGVERGGDATCGLVWGRGRVLCWCWVVELLAPCSLATLVAAAFVAADCSFAAGVAFVAVASPIVAAQLE